MGIAAHKVWRDFWQTNKRRTVFVVLSIVVGVLALGVPLPRVLEGLDLSRRALAQSGTLRRRNEHTYTHTLYSTIALRDCLRQRMTASGRGLACHR